MQLDAHLEEFAVPLLRLTELSMEGGPEEFAAQTDPFPEGGLEEFSVLADPLILKRSTPYPQTLIGV